jgi:hypothetical protein
MKKEESKTTGDIGVDYAFAQSKAIQKSMHLDAEMAYKSLPKQDETEHLLSTETNKNRLLEEPKQEHSKFLSCCKSLEECHCGKNKETLEEVAERILFENTKNVEIRYRGGRDSVIKSMLDIAKWQKEQDKNKYREEEIEDLIYNICGTVARLQGITLNGNYIATAYKQFKNK